MTEGGKILLVDDDPRLRTMLVRYLEGQGFAVHAAASGVQMDRQLEREYYGLLLLDVLMPGEDGFSICQRLRVQEPHLPIIMLTARGDLSDRVQGLDVGADDYLSKPFSPRELLARVRAVLKRKPVSTLPGAPGALHGGQTLVQFGPFEFNLANRTLTRDGTQISLTSGEYALLRVLVSHPNNPLSREKLMDMARGRDLEVFDRSIDVQISRLRRLIEKDSDKPSYIQTVWGVGYVFVPDR